MNNDLLKNIYDNIVSSDYSTKHKSYLLCSAILCNNLFESEKIKDDFINKLNQLNILSKKFSLVSNLISNSSNFNPKENLDNIYELLILIKELNTNLNEFNLYIKELRKESIDKEFLSTIRQPI